MGLVVGYGIFLEVEINFLNGEIRMLNELII